MSLKGEVLYVVCVN